MKSSKILENIKKEINSSVVLWSVIFGIVFFGSSFFLNKPWTNLDNIRVMICTLLVSISTLLFFNVIWEIIAKKSFAEQLVTLVNISENIVKSGIETTYVNFKSIIWDEELQNAKSIKAVFTYSTRWGSSGNNKDIFKKLKDDGCSLEIFLPNPDIEDSIKTLDIRFHSPSAETQIDTSKEIRSAIQFYYDLGFDVYLYDGVFQSSYYLIDKFAFMSFFNHKKPKGTVTYGVPAIKAVAGGEFYSYISDEIEAIKAASKKFRRGDQN